MRRSEWGNKLEMVLIQDSIENKDKQLTQSFLYGAFGKNQNEKLHQFREKSDKANIYVRNYMKSSDRADFN